MLVHRSLLLCHGTVTSPFLPPLFHSTEREAVMGRGQTPAVLQEAVGGSSRMASHWVSSLLPGDMGWWGHFRAVRDG